MDFNMWFCRLEGEGRERDEYGRGQSEQELQRSIGGIEKELSY